MLSGSFWRFFVAGAVLVGAWSVLLLVPEALEARSTGQVLQQANFSELPPLPEIYHSTEKKLVLLDFYASWCGACQRMAPHVESLGKQWKDRLQVIHVDVDKPSSYDLLKRYGIYSTPTFILFSPNGKALYQMRDRLSSSELREQVALQVKQPCGGSKAC